MPEIALAPGLYVVATPIGAARDITLRALDVLKTADVLAAEDTRTTRRLLEIHGIPLGSRRLLSYHDHNGPRQRPVLLEALAAGQSVAYVSDAGTPLVADPGYALVRAAIDAGHPVVAVPGPSAVLTALVASGMPSDRFLFAGFLPNAAGARKRALAELRDVPATLVFFEAPKRLSGFLNAAVSELGADRQAAVCRELTKKFEETRRGSLAELAASYAGTAPKGEVVVLIDRNRTGADAADMEAALKTALETLSVKDAAARVARELSLPRREVYSAALALSKAPE
jgi:16S rRNA (cytidine1402-2'-O)-methyltransferase